MPSRYRPDSHTRDVPTDLTDQSGQMAYVEERSETGEGRHETESRASFVWGDSPALAGGTELSKVIYERGVDDRGFGRIRSKGDQVLLGGYNTAQMKEKWGSPQNRPLADFASLIVINAKALAATLTAHNTQEKDLQGEGPITHEHLENNQSVRQMLLQRGVKPEDLPPEEDLNKLERRLKAQEKKMPKNLKGWKKKE